MEGGPMIPSDPRIIVLEEKVTRLESEMEIVLRLILEDTFFPIRGRTKPRPGY